MHGTVRTRSTISVSLLIYFILGLACWPCLGSRADPDCVTGTEGCCCIGTVGNVDCDYQDIVDIGDLTALIDYLFISFALPVCMEEANVDGSGDGIVDLGDLTALIDYLFISFTPPAACP